MPVSLYSEDVVSLVPPTRAPPSAAKTGRERDLYDLSIPVLSHLRRKKKRIMTPNKNEKKKRNQNFSKAE